MSFPSPVTPVYGTSAKAVTKSDSAVFTPSHIYVGGAGDVTIMPADQAGNASPTAVLFSAVPAGTVVPCQAIQVMSTGTTATLMTRVS